MADVPEIQLTPEQREMSPEWLVKDARARAAEEILRTLDPDISIEWVQADEAKARPGTRRVVQIKG